MRGGRSVLDSTEDLESGWAQRRSMRGTTRAAQARTTTPFTAHATNAHLRALATARRARLHLAYIDLYLASVVVFVLQLATPTPQLALMTTRCT